VRHGLELYGEFVQGAELQYKPDPMQTQSTLLGLFGARWTFIELPNRGFLRGDWELYLRAGLGLGAVARTSSPKMTSTDLGLGATVGGGMYMRVVEACGIGVDFTDDIVATGDGARHNLSMNGYLQVQIPTRN
jgi:hypothetical protein